MTVLYHIGLFIADPVVEALGRHPLDGDPAAAILSVVVRGVDVSGQTKIGHLHSHISINPAWSEYITQPHYYTLRMDRWKQLIYVHAVSCSQISVY